MRRGWGEGEVSHIKGLFPLKRCIFTMAFCLKYKAMVIVSPVSSVDILIAKGWVGTDKNKYVCKGLQLK